MQIRLIADGRTQSGGSPIVFHNERLADPLDPIARALAEVTGKRKKTIEDHTEIGRREFMGGLYTNPRLDWPLQTSASERGAPGLTSWILIRCLQEGAKRSKRGQDVLRGVTPLTDFVELEYDGPRDPVALWKAGTFSLRKSVGVQRNRTMRTRPIFTDWQIRLDVELDLEVFDLNTIKAIWETAGKYAGLCEMRPINGRFKGVVETDVPKTRANGRRRS